MSIHAQILIKNLYTFKINMKTGCSLKNVQSEKQVGNPFISVSATQIIYPVNLSRDACACNCIPSEPRLGCTALNMHLLCDLCHTL